MKRWDLKKQEETENSRVDDFIKSILHLCEFYGYSISHEDHQGGFIICDYDDKLSSWFEAAADDTTPREVVAYEFNKIRKPMTWIPADIPPPFTHKFCKWSKENDESDLYLIRMADGNMYVAKYTEDKVWQPNETGCGCCSNYHLLPTHYMEIPDLQEPSE